MTQIIQTSFIKDPHLEQTKQSSSSSWQSIHINDYRRNNRFRYSYETDQQYLRYCSQQQLINTLQYKLTLLRFIFDLHQSILNKQHQRFIRVGLKVANQNNNNTSAKQTFKQKSHINDKRLRNILMDDIFYQDVNKIQLIKSLLQQSVKLIIKHLYSIKRNPLSINRLISSLQSKVQNYRYNNQSQSNQFKQNNTNQPLITTENYQHYLYCLYQYLFVQIGDIDLYDFLKQILQRWVCGHYQLQERRYLTILNHQTKQDEKDNLLKQKQQILNETSQTLNQTNQSSQSNQQNLKIQKQKNIHIQHQNNQQQTSFILIQQQRTRITQNLMFSSAILPMDHLIKPCCTNFLYQYSQIPSNKFYSNPRSHQIIFITKQIVKLNAQQNEVSFKHYQQPIKQATSALLNNQGGYIFIGFKKIGLYYTPESPFLISQNSIKIIQKKLQQLIGKQITLLTAKNEKQQIPYKKFTVEFIPIFKNNNKSYNDDREKFKGIGQKGDFFWRICIQPDNQGKLKIHSLGESFFDLDKQNQTYINIVDDKGQKDRIYKKLKDIQNNYYRYKIQKPLILTKNSYKLVSHYQKCQKPLDSYFVQKCKQLDSLDIKLLQPIEQNKKKVEKILPSKIQQQKIQESTKQIDYSQDSKVDFKQVNLIVLQNKNIKQSCQRYFENEKIQVKILKLESDYLKKLSKQTYLIYHHKKFDEINNYLNEFKKGYNNKKNISLISAEKSVYVQGRIDCKTLMEIQRLAKRQISNYNEEDISYVEQIKDNKQKSYLKANTKMGGIYLYFILSEMNLKPKIKNVPPNIQSSLVSLAQIIKTKQKQYGYQGNRNMQNTNYNNNYNQQQQSNNNKGQKKTSNKNYNHNNHNNYNNPNNYNYVADLNQQLQQTKLYYLNFFINSYNNLISFYQNQATAISQFYQQLDQNTMYSQPFYAYGINQQKFFVELYQKFINISSQYQ